MLKKNSHQKINKLMFTIANNSGQKKIEDIIWFPFQGTMLHIHNNIKST